MLDKQLRHLKTATVIVFLLGGCVQGAVLPKDRPRDMAKYAEAGPYVVPPRNHQEARAKVEGEIREFLWQHWRDRTMGSLVASWAGPQRNTYTFFVEPCVGGDWHIEVNEDLYVMKAAVHVGPPTYPPPKRVKRTYDARGVRRIAQIEGRVQTGETIPEDEQRSPESYQLVLTDRDGMVVFRL